MAFHPLILTALLALATLQRLTVTQLTLGADTNAPQVEVPFNLIVSAHVRERVDRLENVDLPVLAAKDLELLGDQRSLIADSSGTTYREIIRVVAHHRGTITVDPVTLDAIDALDGKPKRFSSNTLTLNVTGGALQSALPQVDWAALIWGIARVLVPIAALVAVIALFLRRRPRAVSPPPAPAAPMQELPRAIPTRASRLRDMHLTLRAERTRLSVMRVRHVAREMVGADDAETLADVVRRPQVDEPMRVLLTALERAAFTHDQDLQPAIDAVLAALERMFGKESSR